MRQRQIKSILLLAGLATSAAMQAQGITYNHDASKMNQVQVMELGAGVLTPELYYKVLHSNYKSTAGELNKSILRLGAMLEGHKQIEMADSIQSNLKKRAEVEALNMADRQVDAVWAMESVKLNQYMDTLQEVIQRLSALTSEQETGQWQELADTYSYAISNIHTAYLANSLRQKQYLAIGQEIIHTTNLAGQRMQYLMVRNRYSQLTQSMNFSRPQVQEAIQGAHGRWMENARKASAKQ